MAETVEEARTHAAEAVRILVEEAVVIPLAGTYRLWGVRTDVSGFRPHPSSLSQRWDEVTSNPDPGGRTP